MSSVQGPAARGLGRHWRRFAVLAVLFSGLTLSLNAEELFGVTTDNKLIRFDSATPGTLISSLPITNLLGGETVVGIDIRPRDGKIYAIGSTSRLYTLNATTGAATLISQSQFSTLLDGSRFGVDFNPSADLIRVVSDHAQNIRIDPNTGTLSGAAQAPQAYATGTFTGTPSLTGAAYSNNVFSAGSTTLYVLDPTKDALFTQDLTTHGLNFIGFLGFDVTDTMGFDISGQTGVAYAAMQKTGSTTSTLFVINLVTGGATPVGDIGSSTPLVGIAAATAPLQIAFGLSSGTTLRKFLLNSPGTAVGSDVTITGIPGTSNIVGLDFRPANGLLYALTSNGNVFKLFTVDVVGGVAAQVGVDFNFGNTPAGQNYDIDFNPVVDRLRVVNSAGANIRIDPNTGAVAAVDTPLAFAAGDVSTGTPSIVAAAYTNNIAGATTTTLYDLDNAKNILCTQNPPNNGTLNTVAGLKTNGSPPPANTNVGGGASFDIAPDGRAYATLNGSTLFQIDLATGVIVSIGNITGGITEFAIPTNAGTANTSGGAISFSAANFQVVEGSSAQIVLTRTGGSAGLCSVFLSTVDSGPGTTATPNSDYIPFAQTITFADGEVTRTIAIPALTDKVLELFESVPLVLSDPVGCSLGLQSTATMTIADFDDRDGDGFTTAEEAAAGTSDSDATSTPFGGAPAGAADTTSLKITRLAGKLDFVKKLNDSISFTGTLANFPATDLKSLATKKFVVNFGGVAKSFALTAKGSSDPKVDKNNSVKIGTPKNGVATISVKFSKGDFSALLTDENLANNLDSPTNAPRSVLIRVLLNGKRFETTQALLITTKANKSTTIKIPPVKKK